MPELPEVEITARVIGAAAAGARVESALSPGINALRTYDPPLTAVQGLAIQGIGRRGKLFLVRFESELTALIHLMAQASAALDRPDEARERLARANAVAQSTLQETRALSRLLRPQILDDLGLEAALRWLALPSGSPLIERCCFRVNPTVT